ncbi:hypothetical protein BDS110ZK25_17340 [Bradyrhizobium diazoefficiens]
MAHVKLKEIAFGIEECRHTPVRAHIPYGDKLPPEPINLLRDGLEIDGIKDDHASRGSGRGLVR